METIAINTPGAFHVALERRRQIEAEGWTIEHDVREHTWNQLLRAGSAYKWADANAWPFVPRSGFKPKNALRDLIRAGALFQAAVDVAVHVGAHPDDVRRCESERDTVIRLIDELLVEARRCLGGYP